MRKRLKAIAGLVFITFASSDAGAESRQYCVACKDPDQKYTCLVNTPNTNPNDKGLQLYCIIRTSKDGGHKSCAVETGNAPCTGPVRTYTFQSPAIPPNVRSAAEKLRDEHKKNKNAQTLPPQKGGEPETLIEMTGRAVDASRKGLKNTGQSVRGATSSTTGKISKAAHGVGKGVNNAVGKIGSVTKKTGSAVGNAAKVAYDCLLSLFKECGSNKPDASPASQ